MNPQLHHGRTAAATLVALLLVSLSSFAEAASPVNFAPVPKTASGDFLVNSSEVSGEIEFNSPERIGGKTPLDFDGLIGSSYCHNDPVGKVDFLGLHEIIGMVGGHPVLGDPKTIAALAGMSAAEGSLLTVQNYDPATNSGTLDPSVVYILPKLLNLPNDGGGSTGAGALMSNRSKALGTLGLGGLSQDSYTALDWRVMLALTQEATAAHPWGSLTKGEILQAKAEGYISGLDVPSSNLFDPASGAFRSGDVGAPLVANPGTWREVGKTVAFEGEMALGMLDLAVVAPLAVVRGGVVRAGLRTGGRSSVFGPRVASNDILATPNRLQNKLAAWRRYGGDMNLSRWSNSYDVLQTNRLRGTWREGFGTRGASYETPYGWRHVDNAPGMEIKSGYASRTKFIRRQILKDSWLSRNVPGYNPVWRFVDEVPSQPLRTHLDTFGIPYQLP